MAIVTTEDGFRAESNTEDEATIRAALTEAPPAKKAPPVAPPPVPEPEPQERPEMPPESPAEPEPSEPAIEEPDEEPAEVKPPKKHSAAERMLQATKQAQQHRERAERAEAELERLRARLRTPDSAPASTPPAPSTAAVPQTRSKPLESEVFTKYNGDYSAYLEDLSDWKAEQRVTAAFQQYRLEQQAQEIVRTQQQQWQANSERVAAAKGKYADWEDRLTAVDTAFRQAGLVDPQTGQGRLPDVMRDAVLASDRSAEVLYGLGAHPETAVTLAREVATAPQLYSVPALRRILESEFAAPAGVRPGSAAPSGSRANPPIKPVGSSPVAAPSHADDDGLDLTEFVRAGNEAERQRRRWSRGG